MEAIKKLKDWWFIVIFIGTMIVGWTNFENRISQLEVQTTKIVEAQDNHNIVYVEIQKDIVEIKTTLEFIKTRL